MFVFGRTINNINNQITATLNIQDEEVDNKKKLLTDTNKMLIK